MGLALRMGPLQRPGKAEIIKGSSIFVEAILEIFHHVRNSYNHIEEELLKRVKRARKPKIVGYRLMEFGRGVGSRINSIGTF